MRKMKARAKKSRSCDVPLETDNQRPNTKVSAPAVPDSNEL